MHLSPDMWAVAFFSCLDLSVLIRLPTAFTPS
jgi:hypothetical protein